MPANAARSEENDPQRASKSRKNVSHACQGCQQRKIKCLGVPPCAACVKAQIECIIDVTADKRTQSASKKRSLEQDHDALVQLVKELREGDESQTEQLLNLIRGKASMDEIKLFLLERLEKSELRRSPELTNVFQEVNNIQSRESARRSRFVLDAKRLSDTPIFRIPAKPWTQVTDDDFFVSHLVSLWFTWLQPFYNWVPRDLFIRDAQSGNLNAEYCSPFLVNILLADACTYSDYPEAWADPNDPLSRGTHFLAEAKKHLDDEAGRISIVSLQGLTVLWSLYASRHVFTQDKADLVSTNLIGRDRQGLLYEAQVALAFKEVMKKTMREPSKSDDERIKALDITLWGIYNLSTCVSAAFRKPCVLSQPPYARRTVSHANGTDLWRPYPRLEQAIETEAHTACTFNAIADLAQVTADMNETFHGEDEVEKRRRQGQSVIDNLNKSFLDWRSNLLPCLEPHNATMPHVIGLHMQYLALYQVFLTTSAANNRIITGQTKEDMTKAALRAAREAAELANQHAEIWGLNVMPSPLMHWATLSLFTLLGNLVDPRNQESFVRLCVLTKAASRRWFIGRGLLRLVQLSAKEACIAIPSAAESLFQDFESKLWSAKFREYINSGYPNLYATFNCPQDVNNFEMDALLGKWDAMTLVSSPDTKGIPLHGSIKGAGRSKEV